MPVFIEGWQAFEFVVLSLRYDALPNTRSNNDQKMA